MPYSSWSTKRVNRLYNTGRASTAGVSGSGLVTTLQATADGPDGITGFCRLTYNIERSVTAGSDIIYLNGVSWGGQTLGASAPVAANTRYTASVYVRPSTPLSLFLAPQSINGSGAGTSAVSITRGVEAVLPANEWTRLWVTFTTPATGMPAVRLDIDTFTALTSAIGDYVDVTGWLLETGGSLLPFFDGSSPNDSSVPSLYQTVWTGTVNDSPSNYQTRTYTPAVPQVPTRTVSVEEALYGDRVTSYRWEVLEHSNGIDKLVGTLDGVADGSLTWVQNAAVKGSGNIEVIALDAAQPGMLRISDLSLESVRLRPVCTIQGLPENPLGVFLVAAATEDWQSTGRVWSLELLDRTTVPSQDFMEESYAVAAGTPILKRVQQILASSGEYMAIDESNSVATSTGMTWEAGTSKLKIINDLLDVAGYNSLWMDGYGDLQATPRVLPANRSLTYDLLGIPRELQDGQTSIYSPDWTRDRDSFEVPNKVIAIQAAGGEDEAALVGTWTNTDPASPYSYPSRGRWIPHVLDSVETPEGTAAQTLEFLRNRARATLVQMSAVQAEIKITHLPIPIRVSDVLRFVNSKAQVDGRYVVTRIKLDTTALGLMSSTLQEVISL